MVDIVTLILPASKFYPAEDYHQNYHQKNPDHYTLYRWGAGREGFIEKYWGKEKDRALLRKKLNKRQYVSDAK